MNRIKLIQLFAPTIFFSFSYWSVNAQEKTVIDNDMLLKEIIYNENKVKVLNFSLKEFDGLFFEYFDKKSNLNLVLTKEEFLNIPFRLQLFQIDR